MSIDADLDHPIVEIAARLLTPDPQHTWLFDDESAEFLERVLLDQRHDPKLPGAIAGLFHVATELHKEHGATLAAGKLFAVLGKVGPLIVKSGAQSDELFELVGRATRSYDTLLGNVPSGPRG